MQKTGYILLISFFFSTSIVNAQVVDTAKANLWVDSVMNTLQPDERIAQLFTVAAFSNKDSLHVKEIAKLVRDYKIGGLCFFQGGPVRQANLTNYYQSLAKTPLLISIDGEWGLSMRLDSTVRYPKQMALGAINDNQLIYDFGKETARQCQRMGIHLNFAPVVDVNNNPRNPVINDRSFGEDKYRVAAKSIEYMRGLQDNGLIATAKHFPGHGNTDKDSHLTLPKLNRSKEDLDSLELYPFKELIDRGLSSIMVAHLFVPAYDSSKNSAASISKPIVTDLLKNKLNFKGLIITDALNMKGVSANFPPGVVDVKALLAGNDMCLYSENVPVAISEIKKAMLAGEITQAELDEKARKVLFAKFQVGLANYQPIVIEGLIADLNSNEAKLMSRKLYENALTLLENKNNIIPLKNLASTNIAAISIGAEINNDFLTTCELYAPTAKFSLKKDASLNDFDFLNKNLENYNTVIVGLHDMSRNESKNFSLSKQTIDFLNNLSAHKNVVLVVFGNAYSLRNFENHAPIVLAYEENAYTRTSAAQLIFGGIPAKGTMPVTASNKFQLGDGFIINESIRLKYTQPEEVYMNALVLNKIDDLVAEAIAAKAIPGCQVLVAKNGKVVYQKSFGYSTYGSSHLVVNTDLYDLASMTKILSTNLGMMKLVEENKVSLNGHLHNYLPRIKSSNKKNIIIADLLTHRAGLSPFIPFYKDIQTVKGLETAVLSTDSSAVFTIPVANHLFLNANYIATMQQRILKSEIKNPGKYVYSDLSFYFLKEVLEAQSKTPIDEFVNNTFYKKLGLNYLGYLPYRKFPMANIMPTENDLSFRKQVVQGYVHDQTAAMFGGVAGHAGLFGNANDVAIIMQMLLNKGSYGGEVYFKPETVNLFTAKYHADSRRGLGFDKPEIEQGKTSPTALAVSPQTYGHTGFTGTCTWVDPAYDLVYVFLSNRVYPSTENKKMLEMNLRTEIQGVIYNSFSEMLVHEIKK
jgi:beta-glucosidase-like glycosyl hydrolase/CubicO group peptidase (beta-lactamase class C family)